MSQRQTESFTQPVYHPYVPVQNQVQSRIQQRVQQMSQPPQNITQPVINNTYYPVPAGSKDLLLMQEVQNLKYVNQQLLQQLDSMRKRFDELNESYKKRESEFKQYHTQTTDNTTQLNNTIAELKAENFENTKSKQKMEDEIKDLVASVADWKQQNNALYTYIKITEASKPNANATDEKSRDKDLSLRVLGTSITSLRKKMSEMQIENSKLGTTVAEKNAKISSLENIIQKYEEDLNKLTGSYEMLRYERDTISYQLKVKQALISNPIIIIGENNYFAPLPSASGSAEAEKRWNSSPPGLLRSEINNSDDDNNYSIETDSIPRYNSGDLKSSPLQPVQTTPVSELSTVSQTNSANTVNTNQSNRKNLVRHNNRHLNRNHSLR